ncbi:unnamed protein product [Lactuca virosa]|uniref:Uncharacterized protein n=1 Tax=Lactuca virosa TaxID=75947 RepID=A0AAU9PHL4_9ASTR|nr:unnamed protein product [Lactuca virosa]
MFNNFNKGSESQNHAQMSTYHQSQPQTHHINPTNVNCVQTPSNLNQQSQVNQNNANMNHSNFNFAGPFSEEATGSW